MASLDRAPIHIARNTAPDFRTAAESYMQHGGEARYLEPICAYFGDVPLTALTPFDFKQMALAILPNHSGATRNRQAITPAKAVMFQVKRRRCQAATDANTRGCGKTLTISPSRRPPPLP